MPLCINTGVPPGHYINVDLLSVKSQGIAQLEQGNVRVNSLDNDLGDDTRGTGYDVVRWIEQAVVLHGLVPSVMQVHSANPAAAKRMKEGIAAIGRLVKA